MTGDEPSAIMLGAVLTGGRSSRMGRDKATIEIAGRMMVDHVGTALAAVCNDVVAIGPSQLAGSLRAVADRHPGEGPLGGVLTALSSATAAHEWVVVVACDLPWVDAATVRPLIAATAPDIDVVAARTDHLEPLCAVWNVSALDAVRQRFEGGERAVHRVLDALRVVTVDVEPAKLRNVNTPADLDH